ncbi:MULTISPECIES: OmpA family protein [Halomonas]|uniref:Chemotaxis protein MotB n=1 Tax=Halomonas ventosae TaxID=229007 RepID=A0A4R6I617_9GAMM|nr:OmpA family protein [Halomonas ventosae]TDO16806.1 chemotaxis protein MotB [Halomonas ventosae]
MIEDHRGQSRHDNLMRPLPPDEDASGWMISYIDIMTLLVALMVLIITLGEVGEVSIGTQAADSPPERPPGWLARGSLGVPLPEALQRVVPERPVRLAGYSRVSARAISAALGVAGLPASRPSPPPRLLALAEPGGVPVDSTSRGPQLLIPAGVDLSRPLADYLVVLADRPPSGVEKLDLAAIDGARVVAQSLEGAPYLADLAGMEVSRIPAGVRLRVEDRLLFPTAEAELTEAGRALVTGRLREMIQRYPGEVAVEGHSDSRPINTERFPSNWALSSARAIAIVEALVEAGVEPSRLRAVGLADTRPLASNDTLEGRARNRRVEVVIQAR